MKITLGLISKANLAAVSAFSFPLTSMCLGIQYNFFSIFLIPFPSFYCLSICNYFATASIRCCNNYFFAFINIVPASL